MGYFQVRYDSRVVIYERKMFIRLQQATCSIRKLFNQRLDEILSLSYTFSFLKGGRIHFYTNTYLLQRLP